MKKLNIVIYLMLCLSVVIVEVIWDIDVVYTHLNYILIILSGILFGRTAMLIAIILGGVHILISYMGSEAFHPQSLLSSGTFLLVAIPVGILAEKNKSMMKSLEESMGILADNNLQLHHQQNLLLKQQEALITEKAKYSTFIENFQGIVFQGDIEFSAFFMDGAVEAITGYKKEEFVSGRLRWNKIIYADDWEEVKMDIQKIRSHPGHSSCREYRIITRDGEKRWVNEVIKNVGRDGNSNIVQGIILDINDRKKAQQELYESDRRFRETMENMLLVVVNLDAKGRITFANDHVLTLSGWKRDEFIGQNWFDIMIPEDIRDEIKQSFGGKWIREGIPHHLENEIVTIYGKRMISWSNTYLRNTEGNIYGVNSIGEDITDRRRAEQELREANLMLAQRVEERTTELREANVALSRASRLKDEFMANMSHELRTPLSAILGLTESLQENVYGELNSKQCLALKNIEESGRHLLSLINDILDLSKIAAGKLELNISQTSVEEVCHSSLRLIKQEAFRRKIKLLLEVDSNVGWIMTDHRLVKQILLNLLSNAIKFTPDGNRIGVQVQIEPTKNRIRFSVWDEGIGIAPEQIPQLFQPFVQLDTGLMCTYEGTGLGLNLVLKLIELLEGSIEVDSVPGKGSRFSFYLPWVEANGVRSLHEESRLIRDDMSYQQNDCIKYERLSMDAPLLFIEDNHNICRGIADYMQAHGINVICANSGMEGIKMAIAHQPGIIVTDIQMPVMDGFETIRRLKATATLAQIPIIALTALVMPGDRERCLEAGASAYLGKPISNQILYKFIQNLLQKQEG